MICYKFKDNVDGNYIFVIAESCQQAEIVAQEQTSISIFYVGEKPVKDMDPIIIHNSILPF